MEEIRVAMSHDEFLPVKEGLDSLQDFIGEEIRSFGHKDGDLFIIFEGGKTIFLTGMVLSIAVGEIKQKDA